MTEQKLREALQEVIAYARESGHDWLCLTEAEQALATTEPAVNQQLTTEPVDERKAFTNDTKDALMAGRAYAQEALIRFDDAYDRHPSTEPERNAILTDIQLIDAAMAQGVKG